MTAFMGSPASGGALALGAALAFGIYFIWEGATFNEATFDEAAPMPFGAAGAFRVVGFRPDTFACFPAGLMPASFFLFLATTLLA
jgi:hypothetical protein